MPLKVFFISYHSDPNISNCCCFHSTSIYKPQFLPIQVTATDGGTPARSATASVVVVVQDVNDNDPVFSPAQYDVELAEDEPPGTPVVTVTATDADEDNR